MHNHITLSIIIFHPLQWAILIHLSTRKCIFKCNMHLRFRRPIKTLIIFTTLTTKPWLPRPPHATFHRSHIRSYRIYQITHIWLRACWLRRCRFYTWSYVWLMIIRIYAFGVSGALVVQVNVNIDIRHCSAKVLGVGSRCFFYVLSILCRASNAFIRAKHKTIGLRDWRRKTPKPKIAHQSRTTVHTSKSMQIIALNCIRRMNQATNQYYDKVIYVTKSLHRCWLLIGFDYLNKLGGMRCVCDDCLSGFEQKRSIALHTHASSHYSIHQHELMCTIHTFETAMMSKKKHRLRVTLPLEEVMQMMCVCHFSRLVFKWDDVQWTASTHIMYVIHIK